MWILLVVLGLVALIVIVWFLTSQSASAPDPRPSRPEPLPTDELQEVAAQPPRPPSSGAGDPLEMIRAALPAMSSEEIEHLLDMGATLKPGAEELFEQELERRRAEQQGS